MTSVRAPRLVPIAVAIFVLGLLALMAIFVLYLIGQHNLPLWLNGVAGALMPFGLGLALIGLLREAGGRPRRGAAESHRSDQAID